MSRPGLVFLFCLTLPSCSYLSPYSASFITSYQDVKAANRPVVTAELVHNTPYASTIVQYGDEREALLILGKVEAGRLYWYSADGALLVTEQGRIVKTLGLPTDLRGQQSTTQNSALWPESSSPGAAMVSTTYRTDWAPYQYGIEVRTERRLADMETLTILGERYSAQRVEETVAAPQLNWQATNQYWLKPGTQEVLQSVQYVAPELPPIRLTVAKPYREATP